MRAKWSLFFCLLAGAVCFGQQEDKKLLERVMAKPDMSLLNPMNGKKFQGEEFSSDKPAVGSGKFLYDQKLSPRKYQSVRSFLGVKNPWFGKIVHDSRQASLWSRNAILNVDKRISAESPKAPKFSQADRQAAKREQPMKTSSYLGRGAAQGSLDQITDKIDKKMTIDQVRELLNKNR